MKPVIFALLAAAAAAVAGPAWSASDSMAPLDDQRKYADCIALTESDPKAAFDAAIAWRQQAGGVPAWHCVGLALVALDYHAEAAAVFERMAEDMAGDPSPKISGLRAQVLGQSGQAWLQAGDTVRAQSVLNDALALEPMNVELLIDRAQAHAADQGYWQAVDDLGQALEYAPGRSDAYAFRAAAYRHLEILDLAADDVARALALAPNDPVILLERGNIRRLRGDDDGARADWLRILIEAPESPAAVAAQTNLQRLDLRVE